MANTLFSLKVRLLLEKDGSILLLQQKTSKGGNFTLPGGAVEYSENPMEALIREVWEEIGLRIQPEDLELFHTLHKRKRNERRITLYFKCLSWKGEVRNRERNKFLAVAWHPWLFLPHRLSPTVSHVLNEYIRGGRYSEFQ